MICCWLVLLAGGTTTTTATTTTMGVSVPHIQSGPIYQNSLQLTWLLSSCWLTERNCSDFWDFGPGEKWGENGGIFYFGACVRWCIFCVLYLFPDLKEEIWRWKMKLFLSWVRGKNGKYFCDQKLAGNTSDPFPKFSSNSHEIIRFEMNDSINFIDSHSLSLSLTHTHTH